MRQPIDRLFEDFKELVAERNVCVILAIVHLARRIRCISHQKDGLPVGMLHHELLQRRSDPFAPGIYGDIEIIYFNAVLFQIKVDGTDRFIRA